MGVQQYGALHHQVYAFIADVRAECEMSYWSVSRSQWRTAETMNNPDMDWWTLAESAENTWFCCSMVDAARTVHQYKTQRSSPSGKRSCDRAGWDGLTVGEVVVEVGEIPPSPIQESQYTMSAQNMGQVPDVQFIQTCWGHVSLWLDRLKQKEAPTSDPTQLKRQMTNCGCTHLQQRSCYRSKKESWAPHTRDYQRNLASPLPAVQLWSDNHPI